MSAPHRFTRGAGAGEAHLRLMASSDLHAHVHPWDYHADRPDGTVGLARLSALAREMREGAANALLLDNGDFLQGSPLADHVAFETGSGKGHPVIAAMNAAGYDAAALGNHEFNYGLDFLKDALSAAAFPVLCANLTDEAGAPLFAQTAILERRLADGAGGEHAVRIGLFGVLPPQIMVWDSRHLEGRARAGDMVRAAEAAIAALREAGADLVIGLCHTGIGPEAHSEGMENAALPLAALEGLDAMILGHSHRVLPGPDHAGAPGVDAARGQVGGKPAVAPGAFGSHLGVIDLFLRSEGGRWRIAEAESSVAMPEEGGPLDEAVLEAVRADHAATLAYVRRPVGRSATPLHSWFALAAESPAVRIVAEAQAAYMRRMLAGTEWEALPLLSAASPFKAGGRGGPGYYTDVPAGDLAIRNVADLYLYPNTVRALLVTGAEAKDWLERAAGLFNRIAPGAEDAPLIDPGFPAFNFDTLLGLTWEFDLSRPARFDAEGAPASPGPGRVRNLLVGGRPVEPGERFVIVTNSYRASGGGGFPGASEERVIFDGPDANRDILLAHIREGGAERPPGPPSWRLTGPKGATAIFRSGPGSAFHAASAPGLRLEEAGMDEAGFLRWRIRF